jgi:hypothetical protein
LKVIKATGSSNRTTSEIDLGISGLPGNIKSDIVEEVGTYLVEQILLTLGDAKSPVAGESFKSLSKNYKKIKEQQGGNGIPDLELTGAMKDALTFEATEDGLEIGFFGDQAGKADGHNNFSGESKIPKRRFLPGEGQTFKRDIVSTVDMLVESKAGDAFTKSDFSQVESKADLYDVFGDVYGGMSRSSIREAVAGNSSLMDLLIELDLVGYL